MNVPVNPEREVAFQDEVIQMGGIGKTDEPLTAVLRQRTDEGHVIQVARSVLRVKQRGRFPGRNSWQTMPAKRHIHSELDLAQDIGMLEGFPIRELRRSLFTATPEVTPWLT